MKKKISLVIILALSIIVLLFFAINILAIKKLNYIQVCITKQLLYPRQKIDASMVESINVPKTLLNNNIYVKCNDVYDKYVLINNHIGKGSFIYKDEVENIKLKADYPLTLLKENQVAFQINASNLETLNTTLMPFQRVDVYALINKSNEVISDVVFKNVRIIALYDLKNRPFKDPFNQQLYQILLAIDERYINVFNELKVQSKISLYQTSENNDFESILYQDSKILKHISYQH